MDRFAGSLVSIFFFLASVTSASAEMAKDGKFDFTMCFTGSSKFINFDEQHIAFAWIDEKGFARSDPPGGAFDMMLFRCVGSGSVIEGKRPINDYCEFTDKDGDEVFVTHFNITDLETKNRESKVDILAGTGKYTGIKGTGESGRPLVFPEVDPDLFARCVRLYGDYKLL